jgi:surface carbohydrate biosynthesis protein
MSQALFLFLPVETKVREYNAKLLLSCFAAEAGFSVVIGGHVELRRLVHKMPRGIYIEKGVHPINEKNVKYLHNMGCKVAAWCEEGLAILNSHDYVRHRIANHVLTNVDLFFAWGQHQAQAILAKAPEAASKLQLSGNPRIDILRLPYNRIFSQQAEEIRKKYGPFILVNTNFGLYNNFYCADFFMEKMIKGHKRIEDGDHELFYNNWIDHMKMTFEKFVEMVGRLSRDLPERLVILRPHPSENHDRWRRETKDWPNVRVIHEGNAANWLMAADLLVHNSCTTSVEGYILGTPAVSYRPFDSDRYEPAITKAVSLAAFTEEEVVQHVQHLLDPNRRDQVLADYRAQADDLLAQYLAHAQGRFACEDIVDELMALAQHTDWSQPSLLEHAKWYSRSAAVTALNYYRSFRGDDQQNKAYANQKFPGIELNEIMEGVDAFKAAGGRFQDVIPSRVSGTKSCYLVKKQG